MSDNTQKVLLIKKAGVGVSFCGDAIINGATVADFIRRFEVDEVSQNDTTEEVAKKLAEYYKGIGTHFFVSGYNDDVPFLFSVISNKDYNIYKKFFSSTFSDNNRDSFYNMLKAVKDTSTLSIKKENVTNFFN